MLTPKTLLVALAASVATPTNGYFGGTFKFVAVPEPSSFVLLGLGLGGLLAARRRGC
jgi:hypothetical protein